MAKKKKTSHHAQPSEPVDQAQAAPQQPDLASGLAEYAHKLRTQTVAVRVRHEKMGTRKALTHEQISIAAGEFGADSKVLTAAKKIIDTRHPAYRAVVQVRRRARQYFMSMTVPYPEPGTRLIKRDRVEAFDAQMKVFKRELEEAAVGLQRVYAELRTTARTQLGTLFNPFDYPARIDQEFDLDWDFPNVEPPAYLKQLHPELYEQQVELIRGRFEEAVRLTEEALSTQLHKLVSHLVERLRGENDGKPKVFKDSSVENLHEFFEQFKALDLGESSSIVTLVGQCQNALKGATPEELRNNNQARLTVAEQLAQVQQILDGMMTAKPKRAINLDDEEAAPAAPASSVEEAA